LKSYPENNPEWLKKAETVHGNANGAGISSQKTEKPPTRKEKAGFSEYSNKSYS
jgi:hypothetical protein